MHPAKSSSGSTASSEANKVSDGGVRWSHTHVQPEYSYVRPMSRLSHSRAGCIEMLNVTVVFTAPSELQLKAADSISRLSSMQRPQHSGLGRKESRAWLLYK